MPTIVVDVNRISGVMARVRKIGRSSPGQIKPKTIKSICVVYPSSIYEFRLAL